MSALVLLPLVVAAAFLASGLAKLGGSAQLAEAARRFRLPSALATRGWARLFVGVEIAVGVLIVAGPTPWSELAVAAAAVVLAGFLAMAVRAWRRGDDFDCGCFGARGTTRVGPGLVARNASLLAASLGALVAAALGAPTPLETLGEPGGREWLAVTGVLAVGLLAVTDLTARDRVRAAALDAAAAARATALPSAPSRVPAPGSFPSFEVVRPDGEVVESMVLAAHRPHLIVFVRPSCGSCQSLLADVAGLDALLGDAGPVLAYAVSAARSVFEEAYPHLADRALYGVAGARETLGIGSTPGAVLLDRSGRLLAGPALGEHRVRELAASATHLVASPPPPSQ
ncbi:MULTISPECIES: TlpA family protein disulfide reductase [unclassified Rathayibacter]|uniref:TlpA family protein disulfide reductase n=1 Tax=unclassified Rathayibacter TaxID=2609250 RepID=UPI00188BEB37|nr:MULTISPECIES: MauE/DoxX family redox-associated membrane protein [unclassified Rathayibacter]MBF4461258.1 hypothetical protein [Rathayibacter sp. VKM Ac-2879]MBF4502669.1 hypothetical protein [Rathayibacter sp. VKM Ac-2878]